MAVQPFKIDIDHSLTDLKSWIESVPNNEPVFVLMDTNIHQHCYPLLVQASKKFNDAHTIIIPPGEVNKNMESLTHVLEQLTLKNAGRKSAFISLGGGVICDLGGFAASIYKRGIRSVLVPTTLLSQLDASIGGKTGIDFMGHKNLVGSFSFPEKIFISKQFLETLSAEERLNGVAEALKHALVADKTYWDQIKNDPLKDPDLLLARSIAIKTAIVEKDPFEKDLRKILNAGHTIGHALEAVFLQANSPISHGQAVAAGLIIELYISRELGLLDPGEMDEACKCIKKYFPALPLEKFNVDVFIQHMLHDKKNAGNQISFSLIRKIGEASWDDIVPEEMIRKGINFYINQ
jgi:3-dehydroquinate synthase